MNLVQSVLKIEQTIPFFYEHLQNSMDVRLNLKDEIQKAKIELNVLKQFNKKYVSLKSKNKWLIKT